MVCSNCKHELNPLARVCPTCGTPVPGALAVPTVVVAPPSQGGRPPVKKDKLTATRVFIVLFCLLAIAANGALIAFWFLPSIQVTSAASASSITLYSMFELCRNAAPYLTYALIAECVVSIIFCMVPLFKKYANRRRPLIIPKLMTLLIAGCYATPYLVSSVYLKVKALLKGGQVASHCNPFTLICLGLLILLYITGELTIRNRRLYHQRQIKILQDQLTSYGIKPDV